MTIEHDLNEASDDDGRTSRRTALKLGVGAGVGAVAWSGASITSLGGTPAYAQGCTFAVQVNVTGCRNTNQAQCSGDGSSIGYLPFTVTGEIAPDIFLSDGIAPESFRCNGSDSPFVTLTFPAGIECQIFAEFHTPPMCADLQQSFSSSPMPTNISPIVWQLPTAAQTGVLNPNTRYQIVVQCQTIGASGCFP